MPLRKASAAVIAWLRHTTTDYDGMKIPGAKGKRREVRQMLARQSKQLLAAYRSGEPIDAPSCQLTAALKKRVDAAH